VDCEFLYYHLYIVKKKLVLFDFDGTITTKDTLLEFIRFYHGTGKWLTGFLINTPWIALMTLHVIPNWRAKEKVLEWFFAGESLERFNLISEQFCEKVLPALIRPDALKTINDYKASGATVVVISASAENWVEPWCRKNGIPCLATQLEISNNRLTGKIKGVNCYGAEKEKRIRACYNVADFEEVIAYGDSKGDLEMLALASQQFYKPFRK
jgi:phosphatidylglycerophosphatase C